MSKYFIYLGILIFFLCCNDTYNNSFSKSSGLDTIKNKSKSENQDSLSSTKDTVPKVFRVTKNSKINILTINKQMDSLSKHNSPNTNSCSNWALNRKSILEIFSFSNPISGTEWDLSYEVLPCYYYGKVEVDGIQGDYKINAGSFIILIIKGQTFYRGCTTKNLKKYFLSAPFEE